MKNKLEIKMMLMNNQVTIKSFDLIRGIMLIKKLEN